MNILDGKENHDYYLAQQLQKNTMTKLLVDISD